MDGDAGSAVARPDLGLALFQLALGAIDTRQAARPADMVAALAFTAGRAAQKLVMCSDPSSFRLDQTSDGSLILLSDPVSSLVADVKSGTLASVLIDQALRSGAGRLPDFTAVRMQAREAVQRHGRPELFGQILSATPQQLAVELQDGFDALFVQADSRPLMVQSAFKACGQAISFGRNHVRPEDAAEMAMGIALFASWLDRRSATR